MARPKYLTKSRYKLALECPRKLYYTGRPEYANNKSEDSFLLALADSGFQVGELAKQYFPGGIEIVDGHKDKDAAVERTRELLQRDEVVIFEAAFRYLDLYVLVDVLEKRGDRVYLTEVKSKTWARGDDATEVMLAKRGSSRGMPKKGWAPYLNDLAFQKYVVKKAHPEWQVEAFLMMVDKTREAPSDGLNQKFRITRDSKGRAEVVVADDLTDEDLQPSLLVQVQLDHIIDLIQAHESGPGEMDLGFEEEVLHFMRVYEEEEKLRPRLGAKCGNCEFRCTDEQRIAGLRDGFRECWSEVLGWSEGQLERPNVLDLWNFRGKDDLIAAGMFQISDVEPEDIAPKNPKVREDGGLSQAERRELALQMAKEENAEDYFDSEGFQREFQQWKFPLHFIDFETSSEALPFFRGSRPNDPVIFQYSHHVMHEGGRIEHVGQYLDARPGSYPSFRLLRKLKAELEQDDGTIFRYSHHENTCLAKLYELLEDRAHLVEDAEELSRFIRSITRSTRGSSETWEGERSMVDLCDVCERFYLPVSSQGKTSLKVILPAILNGSAYLQDKYSKPIYGGTEAESNIKSLNFSEPVNWVQFDGDSVLDPYKLLEPMFADYSEAELEVLDQRELDIEITEGGAAMVAYRRLQLVDGPQIERQAIEAALLRYCELDTLAMLMLVESWMSGAGNSLDTAGSST